MQHLLNKINYYNTPFHPSDAYSPFEVVLSFPSSSEKISTTRGANFSPIVNESQEEKLNSFSHVFTSSIFMPFLSFCNKKESTRNNHIN